MQMPQHKNKKQKTKTKRRRRRRRSTIYKYHLPCQPKKTIGATG
jgi:hypothetical protein